MIPRFARLAIAALTLGSLLGCVPEEGGESPHSAAPQQADDPESQTMKPTTVTVRVFDPTGALTGPVSSPRVEKSDAQWQAQLTPAQYEIARNKGTERAFCGTLLDNKKEGVYSCVCCGLPLFSSDSKFNSGTGWPSFFRPIAPENVAEHMDRSYGMVRTEITCARCDAHLGHVFDDGPAPTGQRHCLNSESLVFTPKDQLATLADPAAGSKPAAAAATGPLAEAVLAGGCFWCTEAVFEELDGVIDAVSGYAGGTKETANYDAVCSGRTGHAEAIKIIYDPAKISFGKLIEVHFQTHDPTTLNRQGADVGPQYRSAVFYRTEEEKRAAQEIIRKLDSQGGLGAPIVTTLEPLVTFYPAEPYHQNYVGNNPNAGYVQGVAMPKVEKVRKKFKDNLKESSPLDKRVR